MRNHGWELAKMTVPIELDSTATTRLAKSSRLAAVMMLLVFVLLAALIGRNVLRLSELESQIEVRQNAIGELEIGAEALKSEAYALRYAPEDSISVRAHAEAIPDIKENGQQVMDFTVWIDLSTYREKTLTRVTYQMVEENGPFESRVTENAANGFSISYRGTSCISTMTVAVVFKDSSSETLDFDMCLALEQ
jgi:hypothetical protein